MGTTRLVKFTDNDNKQGITMKYLTLAAASLALFAVPAFAQEASSPAELPLKAFAQLPVMQDPELSPDGSNIAFLYPINGRNHLVIQPIFNADRRVVVPPPGELEFRWLNWANNDRLVFLTDFSGKRDITEVVESRLASINKDGSDSKWIIKPKPPESTTGSKLSRTAQGVAPQLQGDVIAWLPNDPDHILVSIDEDFDAKYEVRKVNVNTGDYKKVRGGMSGVQNWMADTDNVVRFGWGYDRSEFKAWFLNSDGDWTNTTRSDWWDQGWRPAYFTDDPMVVFATGPGDHGRSVVVKMNIEDGTILETVFKSDDYDVDGIRIDELSGRPVGVVFTDDRYTAKYQDTELDRLQRTAEKAFGGMNVHIVSLSADRKQLLVKVSSDTDPGVLYYWDRKNKSMDVLSESMPGLTPELLSPVKSVRYDARDGYSIPGYLTLPNGKGDKNLPTIIMPHGGPAARDDQGFWFLTQFLASRGYAVLQPNFRGSTGYGYAHRDAGRNEWGGVMQDDVTDGAKWLVESGVADPERLCIVGWSYGGYAAAMGAVKTPDLYKCAASINGVMNTQRLVQDDSRYIGGSVWSKDLEREGMSLTDISPYHQAERIQIPMLIIQANDDARVHADQGENMAKRLRKLKKPVEYVTVELGGHSMTNAPAREVILESLEKFLGDSIGT